MTNGEETMMGGVRNGRRSYKNIGAVKIANKSKKKKKAKKRFINKFICIVSTFSLIILSFTATKTLQLLNINDDDNDKQLYTRVSSPIEHISKDFNNSTIVLENNETTKVRSDDMWPMSVFYDAVTNPIPTYTKLLAQDAARKPNSWKCTAQQQAKQTTAASVYSNRTIFAFVHVYKAAGTTIRNFFHDYAYTCHKTWLSLAKCTGVLPSSLRPQQQPTQKDNQNWNPCRIEEVADGRHQRKEQYVYPNDNHFVPHKHAAYKAVNNQMMKKHVDIYGGHARIGTGDHIFSTSSSSNTATTSMSTKMTTNNNTSNQIRYILFLRDPIERYVSGVLYQNKVKNRQYETLQDVVVKIKTKIHVERKQEDRYWDKSLTYLLSPRQRIANERLTLVHQTRLQQMSSISTKQHQSLNSFVGEMNARLAIANLYNYNVIVGMTERMVESMTILKHVLLTTSDDNAPQDDIDVKDAAEEVFRKYTPSVTDNYNDKDAVDTVGDGPKKMSQPGGGGGGGGFQANRSSKGKVSTSAVIERLKQDSEFMQLFEEYVKYEQMITNFAWSMHNLQYDAVIAQNRTKVE